MKAKTLAARFSFICVQANEKTLRSISLKRQHSRSLLELTERYDTVMFSIQLQLQRHVRLPYNFFLYFVADYPLSHIHAKKAVFAFFQKRCARVTAQIKNRIQTVVQCLNLLFIKKL